MPDAAVGPHRPSQLTGGSSAFQDGGELGAADAGLHPGGAHRAWPHPDLDDVSSGRDEIACPLGGDHIARDDQHLTVRARREGVAFPACQPQRRDHLLLMPVGGVHHQHVSMGIQCGTHLGGHVTVDPDGDPCAQASLLVECGGVERGTQCPLAGHDADQQAVLANGQSNLLMPLRERVEDLLRRGVIRDGDDVAGHHVAGLREAVGHGGVLWMDQADGAAGCGDHSHAVGTFGDEADGLAHSGVGGDRHGGVEDGMGLFDLPDGMGDHIGRDVLGEDREPAAARHGLGHPPAGDGGHVRRDQRQRCRQAVGGGEVDVQPGGDIGAVRHHEDVGVGQVLGRSVIEETHTGSLCPARCFPRFPCGRYDVAKSYVAKERQ